MNALALRRVARSEQQLRRRIGSGLALPYVLQGEQGWLRLALTDAPPAGALSGWRTGVGELALSAAEPLLALLSDCPTLAIAADEDAPWYWPWWNQQLAPELQDLLGELAPLTDCELDDGLCLTLEAILGERHARSLLCVSAATLTALINKTEWQTDARPLPESMTLTLPMVIGELTLPLSAIQTLSQGDVVLPETQRFTPQGFGIVSCATLQLSGELRQQPGALAHFYLTETEMIDVSLTPDDYEYENAHDPGREWEEPTVNDASAFAPLPLSLSVRCGQLKLTLGELQRLNAGSMVLIENVTPGEAILCHGDYPLAKGELVDVEGQLGLQITHMLPGSKNVLNGDI